MEEKNEEYELEGYMQESVSGVIFLVIGMGIAVLILIFIGVLSGQTYQIVESKIDAISNVNIKNAVKNSIESGFESLETTGDYLPIVTIALIMFMLLSIIVGLIMPRAFGGGGAYGGSVL